MMFEIESFEFFVWFVSLTLKIQCSKLTSSREALLFLQGPPNSLFRFSHLRLSRFSKRLPYSERE
jgi:hypothetical protein